MVEQEYRITMLISIPTLREEGDVADTIVNNEVIQFLSPPSARRATVADVLTD